MSVRRGRRRAAAGGGSGGGGRQPPAGCGPIPLAVTSGKRASGNCGRLTQEPGRRRRTSTPTHPSTNQSHYTTPCGQWEAVRGVPASTPQAARTCPDHPRAKEPPSCCPVDVLESGARGPGPAPKYGAVNQLTRTRLSRTVIRSLGVSYTTCRGDQSMQCPPTRIVLG